MSRPPGTKTGSARNFIYKVNTSASRASLRTVRKQNSGCSNSRMSASETTALCRVRGPVLKVLLAVYSDFQGFVLLLRRRHERLVDRA